MGRKDVSADHLKNRIVVAFEGTNQATPMRRLPIVGVLVSLPTPGAVRRVVLVGLLVTGGLVALQAASQVIDFSVFDLRLRALNADKRDSVFGIASLLAQAAVSGASLWRGSRYERHRWGWLALGALVAMLVIVRGLFTFNAAVLAVPLACVLGLLCWLTWRDDRVARAVVWAGLVLMATSLLLHKVGLEADTSLASDYTWAYQITGVVKHGAELAGWMLVTTGIIAGLKGCPPLPTRQQSG